MKKIQSGQGVTDLGSVEAAAGIDPMGRGEPQLGEVVYTFEGITTPNGRNETVDKPVLEGTSDRTVTFTGHAADEYRKAKAQGGSDEVAYVRANAIQSLMTPSTREAGVRHDGDVSLDDKLAAAIKAKREEIIAKDPSLAPMITQTVADAVDDQIVATARALGQHTCTYDDHGEDSDCWVCNPAAAHRGQPPGVNPEASGGPNEVVGDDVNHPPHYNSHPSGIECIEIARWMMFDPGNALKYVMREEYKGQSKKDAEKSRFYLTDALGSTDRIWGHLDVGEFGDKVDEAKKKLFQVAEAEPDFVKAMFYHALYEGRMERALRAVDALIDRADG